MQIALSVLAAPGDATSVSFISVNRHETDILMRRELDGLAAAYPDRFRVSYLLTQPSAGWSGHSGRGSAAFARAALPAAAGTGGTMVMVCGTDGFVGSWAGELERVEADPERGVKKAKLQGAVGGWLKELGFNESQVYKF